MRFMPGALCALLLSGPGGLARNAAAVQGPESIVPEGTLFYVGLDDLQGFIDASRTKAIGKILKEKEVQDFLQKPLATFHEGLKSALAQMKEHEALKSLDINPDQILKGPYGACFFALTHLAFEKGKKEPDVGLLVGIEAKPGAVDVVDLLRNVVFSLAASEGKELDSKKVEVGELSYEKAETPSGDGPPLCFAKVRNISVLSLSERSMRTLLALSQNPQGSLSTQPEFVKGSQRVGHRPGNPLFYVHIGHTMETVQSVLDFASQDAPDSEKPVVEMVRKALDLTQLSSLGATVATSFWDGDVAVSRSWMEDCSQAGGLVAALSGFYKPIDRGRLKLVPRNALSFGVGGFDLLPLYDVIMNGLKEVAPDIHTQAMAMIRQYSGEIGGTDEQGNPVWDLRRDLIGALRGEVFHYSSPGAATMFGPGGNFVGWVECPNPEGVERSFANITSIPGKYWNFPLTFREETEGDVKLKVLDPMSLGPMAMMAGGMQPTYSLHDQHLYFGSSPAALKSLLGALKMPPEENITTNPDFQRHYGKLPEDAVLTALSYSDTASNFEQGYTQIMSILPMILYSGQLPMDKMPFEMSLIPTAESISQHLFGSLQVTYQQDGATINEARGPFGADLGLFLAAGAGCIGAGMAFMSGHHDATPLGESVELGGAAAGGESAWQGLNDLSAGITVYIVEFGTSPAALDELVAAKEGFPDGILSRKDLPADAWGNAFHYERNGDGYRLWSSGPDGVDNKGEGDDLLIDRR